MQNRKSQFALLDLFVVLAKIPTSVLLKDNQFQ